MFGDGLLSFSSFLSCVGICLCSPVLFGVAFGTAIFMPPVRGIAFGAAFGAMTYFFWGFLFGDTIGLILGAIVFFMTAINQRFITVSSKHVRGATKIYSPVCLTRSDKNAPRIQIIPPANWKDDN